MRPPSSRSKPASKAAPPSKPASTRAKPVSRAASKTPSRPPTSKRGAAEVNGDSPVKKGRVAELADEGRRVRPRISVGGREINAVPQIPGEQLYGPADIGPNEPQRTMLVFGTGSMGQHGLGPDELDEIPRPRIQTWQVEV